MKFPPFFLLRKNIRDIFFSLKIRKIKKIFSHFIFSSDNKFPGTRDGVMHFCFISNLIEYDCTDYFISVLNKTEFCLIFIQMSAHFQFKMRQKYISQTVTVGNVFIHLILKKHRNCW